MRTTLGQAREATRRSRRQHGGDEAQLPAARLLQPGVAISTSMSISPAEYRTGVLENGKRKAMRIWLKSAMLLEAGPDGTEALTDERARAYRFSDVDLPRSICPSNPLVVEGYAPAATVAERFRLSAETRGKSCGNTCSASYASPAQNAGFIGSWATEALEQSRQGSVGWCLLTLFLDREQRCSSSKTAVTLGWHSFWRPISAVGHAKGGRVNDSRVMVAGAMVGALIGASGHLPLLYRCRQSRCATGSSLRWTISAANSRGSRGRSKSSGRWPTDGIRAVNEFNAARAQSSFGSDLAHVAASTGARYECRESGHDESVARHHGSCERPRSALCSSASV